MNAATYYGIMRNTWPGAGNNATFDEVERAAIWKERAADSIEHIFSTDSRAWLEREDAKRRRS